MEEIPTGYSIEAEVEFLKFKIQTLLVQEKGYIMQQFLLGNVQEREFLAKMRGLTC